MGTGLKKSEYMCSVGCSHRNVTAFSIAGTKDDEHMQLLKARTQETKHRFPMILSFMGHVILVGHQLNWKAPVE